MDPAAQQKVLILAGFVVTLVILSFFLIRKSPRPPVKLELRNEPPKNPAPGRAVADRHRDTPGQDRYAKLARQLEEQDTDPFRPAPPREKSLNVLFNWNGHTWDAYEVLGVAAGSSREAVLQAYNKASAQADPDSQPFLKAALTAITGARG